MKLAFVAIISILIASSTFAQSAGERFEMAKRSILSDDDVGAVEQLRSIANSDPAAFKANNLDYLLARLYQRSGDTAQAGTHFQSVRARRSVFCEYATWHLAEMARLAGNLAMERVLLTELLADRPDSLLAAGARQRIAESNFESKNYDSVVSSSFGAPVGTTAGIPRDIALLRARAFLYKGDQENARSQFETIIASTSNPSQPDDLALGAVSGIDLIEVGSEQAGKAVAKLSDYEHLKRAQIYHFNRDFAAARLHYLAIVNDHPNSGIAPDAMYQIGRGFTQSANFSEAVKWYERVGELHAAHAVNKDATLQLASSYARLERYREAVVRYERFIQNYPEDERIDRAHLNIIDVLRDAGEETEALLRAQKAQDVFRGKVGEAQALFSQVRVRLARSDWQNALTDLGKLAGLKQLGGDLPGGTTPNEIAFLRAFVLEQLRRFTEAIDTYLSIPDGRKEYYGWRATERLRGLNATPDSQAAIEAKRKDLESPMSDAEARRIRLQALIRITTDETKRAKLLHELRGLYSILPPYKSPAPPKSNPVGRKEFLAAEPKTIIRSTKAIADELLFLGLYDEAAPAYEASLRGSDGKAGRLSLASEYTIAEIDLKGDRADRSAVFIEQFAKLPIDFQPELLASDIAFMLFPVPYRDHLVRTASSRNVDPRFLLSIMRQESGFRPNVKSVAAARGLMQFISDTADRIAGQLGRESFDQNELYHPPTAILFGSQYVSGLFKLFPDQPEAVAASYNGGEDSMKRWQTRSRSDRPERYVPEIAFAQSKDYAWRVMVNYRMYQLLYDEKLNRK